MLSLRDVIDFAAMSEDLACELNNPKVALPELGAIVARNAGWAGNLRGCSAATCTANDVDAD